jgi:endonuclease/exonuclease/phosphatase family metal-dependent hydrolase
MEHPLARRHDHSAEETLTSLTVATLNIRNIADRWGERLPLLLADMAALQPDVMGLQECVFAVQQDRILGAAGAGRYVSHRGWATRPEYGNATLVREGLRTEAPERFDLGHGRSALRTPLTTASGESLDFVVTHLHHVGADEAIRTGQAAALTEWLSAGAAHDAEPRATIVVGDFNTEPVEDAYRLMIEADFRSAHLEANGAEPEVTWPSGIQAPGIDTDGDPGCLDYIWVRGPITVESCRVAFDRPAVDDPTLYPSDHFGLVATLQLGG